MFFAKNFHNTLSKPVENDSSAIYIAGMNPLGFFLASRLQNAGHRVILIDTPKAAETYTGHELNIKTETPFRQTGFLFDCRYEIKENPRFLLICGNPDTSFSQLAAISPSKLQKTVIVSISAFSEGDKLMETLRLPVINAYFGSWFKFNGTRLEFLGGDASLTLSLDNVDERAKAIRGLFEKTKTDIRINCSYDDRRNFWEFFIPWAAVSLCRTATGKNILSLTGEDAGRRLFDACLRELISLAGPDAVNLEYNDLLRSVYNIPDSFVPELSEQLKKHDFKLLSRLSAFIGSHADINKPTQELRRLLKTVYDKNLA